MSQRTREIVLLILQFLDEEKFKETVHKLEQESGFFFNLKYFEDEVHNGNWEEVERYLSGFTKVDDNRYSMKIFFEIRKQKYLEALDKHDRSKAVDILVKDLKVFATFNEELFKEITQLLTLENFRENEQLSKYGDTKSARAIMLVELKKLFEANPLFRDKFQFPNLKNSRLRTLINQSLNWQHQLCKNPRPNPDIKTLFVDHSCGQPNGACAPSPANNLLLGSLPKAGGFHPLGAHGPFQPTAAPVPTPPAGWMSNPSTVTHPAVSESLNWQHQLCKNPSPYSCRQPNGFPPLGAHGPRMVLTLSRELVFLILQFLNEQEFKETLHKLEEESGFFFNMRYFEDEVNNGNWDEVERYLSGFTEVEDNEYLIKMSFEIRKQKYLEALDRHDHSEAIDMLVKDLEVLATFNEDLFNEISQLLTSENFRQNEKLSKYVDTKSARSIVLVELKKLIEENPVFHDKLQFPYLEHSRLRTLIDQSLNWQHQLCKNPRPNLDIKTLFVDHSCARLNGAHAPSPANNPLLGSLPNAGGFFALGAHEPFHPATTPIPSPLDGRMSNPSAVIHPAASEVAIDLGALSILGDCQSGYSDHVTKTTRLMGVSDEVNVLPVTSLGHGQNEAFNTPDDLPKIVIRTLNQGSSPTSMDFHPVQPTVLLVGTKVGDIGLWEVGSGKTFVLRNFKVWDLGKCSMSLQAALVKDPSLSVNCVTWSPEGSLFGVAYSKHIVQIYSYHGDNDVRQHMEIDAHVGGVNDLAFSHPNKQLVIITCGDDKTIKVWDAVTGAKQYTFEGHEAPVYSVCPHYKKNIPFIFSTAVDGKIKAWLYDNLGSRVDFDAPGHWCTTMAYSTDGTRLFSCGTSKEGESYIVEWNESEGAVKRNYQGFQKRSLGVVQFDTTRNRFLAAGDDFSIKFWNMDNVQLLTTIDADGGLPACPRICFNKDGTLLAVSTYENGIKILANSDGIQLLHATEYLSYNASRTSEMVTKNGDNINLEDVKPGLSEETNAKSKKLTDITEPSQFRSFKLSENVKLTKSGSLKPSDDCKFAYMSPTVWNKLAHGSRKAAVLENVKGDWKKVAIVFLVFLIIIYSFGFCPFKRSNSEDNAYLRWKRYP